jgi:hypothetical protein
MNGAPLTAAAGTVYAVLERLGLIGAGSPARR